MDPSQYNTSGPKECTRSVGPIFNYKYRHFRLQVADFLDIHLENYYTGVLLRSALFRVITQRVVSG
jgi:hypothetical protein